MDSFPKPIVCSFYMKVSPLRKIVYLMSSFAMFKKVSGSEDDFDNKSQLMYSIGLFIIFNIS